MAKNLFNVALSRDDIDQKTVLDKISRAKQLSAPTTSNPRVGGNNLIQTITQITSNMEKYLGDKRDNYLLLRTEQEIENYITQSISTNFVAIDTETTGLDPIDDDIVGFSLYSPGMKAAYVPISHVSYVTNELIPNQPNRDFLKAQLMRYAQHGTYIIMFNAGFDIRVLRHSLNVYLHCWYDASIAAKLLNENEVSHRLKDLHKKYILKNAEDEFTFSALFEGTTFNLIPIEVGYLYAAKDAEVTWELFEFQYPFLNPNDPVCQKRELTHVAEVFWNVEMPCVEVLADMEDRGIRVDLSTSDELKAKYIPLLESKVEAFNKILLDYNIQEHIDVASPQQLAHLFYDILHLKSPDRKNPRGTGKEIIDQLDHPIVDAVKEYKALATLVNAFVIKLPEVVRKDGRIHCQYNQLGAKTGRMSCKDPNL